MALCLAMIGFLELNTVTLSKMRTVPRVHLREAAALWRVVIAILFTYGARVREFLIELELESVGF